MSHELAPSPASSVGDQLILQPAYDPEYMAARNPNEASHNGAPGYNQGAGRGKRMKQQMQNPGMAGRKSDPQPQANGRPSSPRQNSVSYPHMMGSAFKPKLTDEHFARITDYSSIRMHFAHEDAILGNLEYCNLLVEIHNAPSKLHTGSFATVLYQNLLFSAIMEELDNPMKTLLPEAAAQLRVQYERAHVQPKYERPPTADKLAHHISIKSVHDTVEALYGKTAPLSVLRIYGLAHLNFFIFRNVPTLAINLHIEERKTPNGQAPTAAYPPLNTYKQHIDEQKAPADQNSVKDSAVCPPNCYACINDCHPPSHPMHVPYHRNDHNNQHSHNGDHGHRRVHFRSPSAPRSRSHSRPRSRPQSPNFRYNSPSPSPQYPPHCEQGYTTGPPAKRQAPNVGHAAQPQPQPQPQQQPQVPQPQALHNNQHAPPQQYHVPQYYAYAQPVPMPYYAQPQQVIQQPSATHVAPMAPQPNGNGQPAPVAPQHPQYAPAPPPPAQQPQPQQLNSQAEVKTEPLTLQQIGDRISPPPPSTDPCGLNQINSEGQDIQKIPIPPENRSSPQGKTDKFEGGPTQVKNPTIVDKTTK